MDLNAEFTNQWQEFERALVHAAGTSDVSNFRDALSKLRGKNVYVRDNYEQIEDLYSLRNVFSHRKRGNYIAEIEQHAINEVTSLLDKVQTPPTVLDIFGCEMFIANEHSLVETVMDNMVTNVYTHVPVYKDERFIGVFSYTTFFDWLHRETRGGNHEPKFVKKVMGDIGKQFLNSPSVNYEFMASTTNAFEVPIVFERKARIMPRPERLDCILITESGRKDETVIGIITSWDLGKVQ